MSVIGIDKEKCSNCKQCILECGRAYFYVDDNENVAFNESLATCNICGHCIAICPEEAILTEKLDDVESYKDWEIDTSEELVNYDNMFKLLRFKRSIRRYKSKEVPREILDKVFEAMRYAPSASNNRMWRYLILSDPEKIKALGLEIVKTQYMYLGFKSPEQAVEYFESIDRGIFYKAPHVIVLYYKYVEKNNTMLGLRANDAGIALTYGMLAAESLGLGTCWIGMIQGAIPMNRDILKFLGIKGQVLGAFTLGYPAVKYRRTAPRPPLKIKGLED